MEATERRARRVDFNARKGTTAAHYGARKEVLEEEYFKKNEFFRMCPGWQTA
jgi:hypothetical protein